MWDVGLASMFKERDNKGKIGACIGTVVSVNPLKISILKGNIVLQGEQLYIPEILYKKTYKLELKADNNIGEIAITSKPSNPLISININDKDKTELILHFELKKDAEVLLIPAENEQSFFVIDVYKKVGG